jgi:zinc protease
VREPDFERARTTLLAEWRAQFSTADGLAAALDQAITRGLSLEAFAAYPDRVQAVTRADVQRVARRYLGDEALHIVVSGSDEVLRPLAGLGLGAPVRRDLWAEAEGP